MWAEIELYLHNYFIIVGLFILSSFLLGWGFSIVKGDHEERAGSAFVCICLGLIGMAAAIIMYLLYNHITW